MNEIFVTLTPNDRVALKNRIEDVIESYPKRVEEYIDKIKVFHRLRATNAKGSVPDPSEELAEKYAYRKNIFGKMVPRSEKELKRIMKPEMEAYRLKKRVLERDCFIGFRFNDGRFGIFGAAPFIKVVHQNRLDGGVSYHFIQNHHFLLSDIIGFIRQDSNLVLKFLRETHNTFCLDIEGDMTVPIKILQKIDEADNGLLRFEDDGYLMWEYNNKPNDDPKYDDYPSMDDIYFSWYCARQDGDRNEIISAFEK